MSVASATIGALAAIESEELLSYTLFAVAFMVAFAAQGASLMTDEPPKPWRVALGGALMGGLAGAAATFLLTFIAQFMVHGLHIPQTIVVSLSALLGLLGYKRVLALANRALDVMAKRVTGRGGSDV